MAEIARARARAYLVCLTLITLYLNAHPVFILSLPHLQHASAELEENLGIRVEVKKI